MLADIIKERDVDIHQLLIASILGSAAELGLLNQVTVTLIVRNTGKHIAEFLKLREDADCAGKDISYCVKMIMSSLGVAKEYEVSGGDDGIKVAVPTELCKFCPKGVAGAEFLGTACPLPGLIESIVKKLVDEEWSLVQLEDKKHFIKEDDFCRFAYTKAASSDSA